MQDYSVSHCDSVYYTLNRWYDIQAIKCDLTICTLNIIFKFLSSCSCQTVRCICYKWKEKYGKSDVLVENCSSKSRRWGTESKSHGQPRLSEKTIFIIFLKNRICNFFFGLPQKKGDVLLEFSLVKWDLNEDHTLYCNVLGTLLFFNSKFETSQVNSV